MGVTSNIRKTTGLLGAKTVSGNRSRAPFRAKRCNQYSFLNEPIKEIAYFSVSPRLLFDGGIDWERNLPYLEASARKWCELHDVPYEVEQGNDPFVRVSRIYEYLTKVTDEYRFDIDYDSKDNMLKFIEYRYCDFPECTVFFLPVKYLNRFEGQMREMMKSFLSFLFYETLFNDVNGSFDFSMLLEMDKEYLMENEDIETAKMIDSYTKGEARALFDEIENVGKEIRSEDAILSQIANLPERDKFMHESLIENIKRGMKLIKEDDLRNHAYFDGYCSDERFDTRFSDGDYILPDRMFVMCYGMDNEEEDPIAAAAVRSFSEEANNMEVLYFRDGRHLSPDDNEIFEPSTYPQEWADWFGEFIDLFVVYE